MKYIPALLKTSIFCCIAIALILQSCDEMAQIDGNGTISIEARTNERFSDIDIDGVMKVVFVMDSSYSVLVKTDENIQGIVSVENSMGLLKVKTDESADFDATELIVYIHGNNFKNISIDGVVDVEGQGSFRQASINIDKNGIGTLDLHIEVERFTLTTDDIGSTYLDGIASFANLSLKGEGSLHAYNLYSQETTITTSGIGFAEIQVTQRLNATLKGIGNVYCKGNPEYIQQEVTGIGMLILK